MDTDDDESEHQCGGATAAGGVACGADAPVRVEAAGGEGFLRMEAGDWIFLPLFRCPKPVS
jgi:hypothetical protein